jgi:hypothetical protein
MTFACLDTVRNTSKFKKRSARYYGQNISATSENYAGTKEIYFATLTAEGSTYFTEHTDVLISRTFHILLFSSAIYYSY